MWVALARCQHRQSDPDDVLRNDSADVARRGVSEGFRHAIGGSGQTSVAFTGVFTLYKRYIDYTSGTRRRRRRKAVFISGREGVPEGESSCRLLVNGVARRPVTECRPTCTVRLSSGPAGAPRMDTSTTSGTCRRARRADKKSRRR